MKKFLKSASRLAGFHLGRIMQSGSERFKPPFTRTFIPLVPLASQGRRGVLIQTF
jgi:hypothetical protein